MISFIAAYLIGLVIGFAVYFPVAHFLIKYIERRKN